MGKLLIVFLLVLPSIIVSAEEVSDSYKTVNLKQFYNENHIPVEMAAEKKRVMLKPTPIRFKAELASKPLPGKFSLAYEALQLWGNAGELPVIDHSAFVGFPDKGPVLGVYVTQEAAGMLKQVDMDKPVTFYAMHIYNYAKGPRLVIVAAESK